MASTASPKYESVLFVLTLYILSDIAVSANIHFSLYEPSHLLGAPEEFYSITGPIALALVVLSHLGIPRYFPAFFVTTCGVVSAAALGMSVAELSRDDHSDAPSLVQSLAKTLITASVGTAMAVFRAVKVIPNPNITPDPVPIGYIGIWTSLILCFVFGDALIAASLEHHIGPSHYVLGLTANGSIILVVYFSLFVALSAWYALITENYSKYYASDFQTALAALLFVFSLYQAVYALENTAPSFAAIRATVTAALYAFYFSSPVLGGKKNDGPENIQLLQKIKSLSR